MTIDADPQWRKKKRPKGIYVSTVWVPGNYLSEGTLYVTPSMVALEPRSVALFDEDDIICFKVFDPMEGGSARGDWMHNLPGVVRPLLKWETEFSGSPA